MIWTMDLAEVLEHAGSTLHAETRTNPFQYVGSEDIQRSAQYVK